MPRSSLVVALALVFTLVPAPAQAGESFAIPPGEIESIRTVLVDAIAAASEAGQLPLELSTRVDIRVERDHFYVTLHANDEGRSATLPHLVVYHPEAELPADASRLGPGVTLRCGGEGEERACEDAELQPWIDLAAQIDRRRAAVAEQIWTRRPAAVAPEPEPEPAPTEVDNAAEEPAESGAEPEPGEGRSLAVPLTGLAVVGIGLAVLFGLRRRES